MIRFSHKGIDGRLARRRLLCADVTDFLAEALQGADCPSRSPWQVELGPQLLFDAAGLEQIARAVNGYTGTAGTLGFFLKPSPEAVRDYYSHQVEPGYDRIILPVEARRDDDSGGAGRELVALELPELATEVPFPMALTPPDRNRTPLALLLPCSCDHDLLFANQIAIISRIAASVRRSPSCWLKALFARQRGTLRQRLPLFWNRIDPSARIHPTAVVEGSVIGPECRIGAHCVVRYSVLGEQVHLHDGAKVEYSAVDDRTWLMHDLVLYRSVAESDVFLIHGPYQFSLFQHASAAFATIMMDYRPDGREITIATPSGPRKYRGRFLGALLEEEGRVFGGTLTAPGITIPAGREVYSGSEVVRGRDLLVPR